MVVVVCPCCFSTNVDKDKEFEGDFKCNNCRAEFNKSQADFEEQ